MDSDGRSRYFGADADGNPTGFATVPTAHAGFRASYYPARCAYCSEMLNSYREQCTHMVVRHPA